MSRGSAGETASVQPTGGDPEGGETATGAGLWPDLAPLRSSRGFRLVFASRTVTALGAQASEVALLVQARQLTGSPLAVGLLGIFRETLWNQTIPDDLRGRLAGVKLLSYGVGPPAGQLRSGVVASLVSIRFSLVSGGLLCVGAVALVCGLLPDFVRYKSEPA